MHILGFRQLWLYLAVNLAFALPTWAQKPQNEPVVFRAGHYRLADGVRHEGQLCLMSDNELLVKSADTARTRRYAAVQLRDFVIAADSFTVLRNIDVTVNDVITRYPSAMVQVMLPGQALPLYRLSGPMEVFPKQANPAVRHALRGVSGGAVGIAAGLLADDIASNSPKRSKEQTLALLVLRATPNAPLETQQPQTTAARTRLQALVAGNAELTARLRKTPAYLLKEEEMLAIFRQYFASLSPAGQ